LIRIPHLGIIDHLPELKLTGFQKSLQGNISVRICFKATSSAFLWQFLTRVFSLPPSRRVSAKIRTNNEALIVCSSAKPTVSVELIYHNIEKVSFMKLQFGSSHNNHLSFGEIDYWYINMTYVGNQVVFSVFLQTAKF